MISVVIPTFERRAVVLASLEGYVAQSTPAPFEVLVVIDGGTDGTASALSGREWPFPLHVIEQENSGAAAARNAGAQAACAPVLLFTDDDMEPNPSVIELHLDAHAEGAEVVVGAMPLHPASPETTLSAGVGRWAEKMAQRCAQPDYVMTADDVFTGHLSVRREIFEALGGFNTRFTAGGTFGNEDVDLAQRLINAGVRITFRPDAITRQRFVVTAREHLRRGEELGAADMALLRAHPDLENDQRIAALRQPSTGRVGRAVALMPRPLAAATRPLEMIVTTAVDRGADGRVVRRVLRALYDIRYWRGVRDSGGPVDGTELRVLCWHALQDLSSDPVLSAYGVPPETLANQLATLKRAGWVAVTPEEVVRFVRGGAAVPRRSFLATFDDCYRELVHEGRQVLAAAEVPAAAFVVTDRVGESNRWDAHLGAQSLPLATWDELAILRDGGVELGAHSRTHPELTNLSDGDLAEEIDGAALDLARRGVRPRLFAYPHGDHDERVERITAAAGFDVAFTVTPGIVRAGVAPYRVPRFEVMPDDSGRRLLRKVVLGGRWPLLWVPASRRPELVRAEVRRVYRGVRRRLGRLVAR